MSLVFHLPIPPIEMRRLVGPTNVAAFDNPTGEPILPELDAAAYRAVFDFGCGCGRLARRLAQQSPRPARYVGVDLHAGMIDWCQQNLAPGLPGWEFHHHDVANVFFNPGGDKPSMAPLPVEDGGFSLALAWSVFTHVTEEQCVHYLRELARVLVPGGVVHSTWFLLDRQDFPFMSAHALYGSYVDPSAAVVFDRDWVREQAEQCGLTIDRVIPPAIRGYHWQLQLRKSSDAVAVPFPPDRGTAELTVEEIASGRHRTMVGGKWEELGRLQLDFLVGEGLRPHMRLLDVGCGCLRGGVQFVRYLEAGNYWGVDRSAALLFAGRYELGQAGLADRLPAGQLVVNGELANWPVPADFDVAIAQSLFTHLGPAEIARCLREVAGHVVRGGCFYATYFACPDEHPVADALVHEPGGITSFGNRDPWHYRTADLLALAEVDTWAGEDLGAWNHPRDQRLLRFVRR